MSPPTRPLAVAAAVAVPGSLALGLGLFMVWLYRWSTTETGYVNFPPPRVWANLVRLDAVVARFNDALSAVVTSAYRSVDVNAAVGGEPDSHHLEGRGLDLVPAGGSTWDDLRDYAAALVDAGVLTGSIDEGDHVHVTVSTSWVPEGIRGVIVRTLG